MFVRTRVTAAGNTVYVLVRTRRLGGRVCQQAVAYLGPHRTLATALAAMLTEAERRRENEWRLQRAYHVKQTQRFLRMARAFGEQPCMPERGARDGRSLYHRAYFRNRHRAAALKLRIARRHRRLVKLLRLAKQMGVLPRAPAGA
jgi:hypothetical protein